MTITLTNHQTARLVSMLEAEQHDVTAIYEDGNCSEEEYESQMLMLHDIKMTLIVK
jgi:hypothetical protein